ncbi:hypothetical protein ABW21_db0203422 [Orbilia brochopaga]|nr:hypothetical protein ABW21_db0203422 [Drechslerella brochopaga]
MQPRIVREFGVSRDAQSGPSRSVPPTSVPGPSIESIPDESLQPAPTSAFGGPSAASASNNTWQPPPFSFVTPKKQILIAGPNSPGSPMDLDSPTPKKNGKGKSLLDQFNLAHQVDSGTEGLPSPTQSTILIHSSPPASLSGEGPSRAPDGKKEEDNNADQERKRQNETEGDREADGKDGKGADRYEGLEPDQKRRLLMQDLKDAMVEAKCDPQYIATLLCALFSPGNVASASYFSLEMK